MDKEELYEKVIELMERVRELEQIIEDDRDDLDDTNKRLSDAEAENAELRKALDNYKDLGTAELPPLGSVEDNTFGVRDEEKSVIHIYDELPYTKKLLADAWDEIKSLKKEIDQLHKELSEYYKPVTDGRESKTKTLKKRAS